MRDLKSNPITADEKLKALRDAWDALVKTQPRRTGPFIGDTQTLALDAVYRQLLKEAGRL